MWPFRICTLTRSSSRKMALTRSKSIKGGSMATQRRWALALLVGGVLLGCSRVPDEAAGTGAKECVQAYYAALIRKDWPRAYANLDPQSQKRVSSQQFNQLAQSYRTHLGFAPESIQVRACEERGT